VALNLQTLLTAVPNVSDGSDLNGLAAVGEAFQMSQAAQLLTTPHSDVDHGRTVFTLAAEPGELSAALVDGAREALKRFDLSEHDGTHPNVGVVDVVPVVFLDEARRGAALAEALVTAECLANQLELPIFLYGALAGGRTRAELRRGGLAELTRRIESGELKPDFGPIEVDPTKGVTLVAARPPLIAFNLELAAPATLGDAKAIAALIREGGSSGLPGLKAIGLELPARGGVAQVSMNIEDVTALSLADVVEAANAHSPVAEAELVGLAPRAAFDGWPEQLVCRNRATLEDALGF
jgi:glutamate formiminotransferase/glutamate formiminotransferase/formiminotetrahydrofolate cyclodeaminase